MADPNEPHRSSPTETAETETSTNPARHARLAGIFGQAFSVLSLPEYRWYFGTIFTSTMAMQSLVVARGWLAYDLTKSPLALGTVMFAWGMPIVCMALMGGVMADRLPRHRIMVVMQLVMALISLSVAVLITTGEIRFWHLVASSLAHGIAMSINNPSRASYIFDLVGNDRISNAIALNSSVLNTMRIVAPALAGLLIAYLGVDTVYYLIFASYCGSACIIKWKVPALPRAKKKESSPLGDFAEVFRYLKRDRIVQSLLLLALLMVLIGLPFRNLMPAFTAEVLRVGPEGYGFVMSMLGVGAIAGSFIVAFLGNRVRRGNVLFILGLGWGFSLLAFSRMTDYHFALGLALLLGLASATFTTINNILLQSNVANEMRGRILSLHMMTFGMNALGTLPIGAISETYGVAQALTGCGVLLVFISAGMYLWRGELRRVGEPAEE